jgi:hypothetical protein
MLCIGAAGACEGEEKTCRPEREHEIPVQDIKELLQAVTDKVPALLTQLRNTLFSAEAGQELGRAVGAFYKELVDSGIPAEDALAMAKGYINSLQSVMEQAKWSGKHEED